MPNDPRHGAADVLSPTMSGLQECVSLAPQRYWHYRQVSELRRWVQGAARANGWHVAYGGRTPLVRCSNRVVLKSYPCNRYCDFRTCSNGHLFRSALTHTEARRPLVQARTAGRVRSTLRQFTHRPGRPLHAAKGPEFPRHHGLDGTSLHALTPVERPVSRLAGQSLPVSSRSQYFRFFANS